MIEVLLLLGTFVALCMIGMPVAYTLGLAAIVGALWIDVPGTAPPGSTIGPVIEFSKP